MSLGIIRVGVSGWTYAPWRGAFYPKSLQRQQELAYAAHRLGTIEINGTFYGLQKPEAFRVWAEQVPAGFVFAVKAPRLITHVLRLQDAQAPLANFIASGLLRLGVHLGPILWQLPANLPFDPTRLDAFLRLLPRSTHAALTLGRQHDRRLSTTAWLQTDAQRPLRHALEVRHESFRCQAFIDLLRAHDVALVCADTAVRPWLMDLTSDFVYCRLHGPAALYAGGYDSAELDVWADRCRLWAAGEEPRDAERIGGKGRPRRRDVFVYFDNDARARAPANAAELIRRLRA
ncbi:MAG TPA: DUF72 domain-containing protein [Rhodopila sp.]|nr:DUF72 domain-containing protein [Rhodopila sp.]